jgi:spermidine synthase
MTARVPTMALFLLVSGLCALIFQTAWLREFRLIFGASTPASAAVLAIFMGGLGLGNAILGKRVDASANPLKLYALLELGISAASVVSPFLIVFVRSIYFSLGGQETLGITGATVVRLLLSALVIGVPTFLMGGTLPAAARVATAADDRARGSIGWLYGLNTIGAVIGTLASTFVLLEWLGNRETLWAAAAVNIVNAFLAWRLSQSWSVPLVAELADRPESPAVAKSAATAAKRKGGKSPTTPDSKHRETNATGSDAESPAWLLYFVAAAVGFVFLLMEIVWYRMLGPILGGTAFTFGIILAVALAGIGVGGALYPLLFRRRVPTLRDLALTCGWEALALAAPLAWGDGLAILAAILRELAYFGFGGQAAGWTIVAALVIFPAAVISGLQFPLIIALLGQGSGRVGRQVGYATAANTLGAMSGSLAGGFGLLPLATAPGAWRLAVIVLALLSLVALVADTRRAKQVLGAIHPLAAAILAGLCLLAPGPTALWRHGGIGAGRATLPEMSHNALVAWIRQKRAQVFWEADGRESSVAMLADVGVSFAVNGKNDGNAITDSGTQIMFPLIGAMIHHEPRQALVIGLGTGESAGWLAELPSMEHVDVVELEPVIQKVAERCAPLNHNVLRHPKVRVIFNDGREALQTSVRRYDLIASEPSNPYRAGVANLYTLEFYQSVRGRLAERGLFVQWLQGYEIDAPTVRTVLCTARAAFPHVEIWEAKPADLVLVCSNDPFDYDLPRLRQRVSEPVIREALRIGWQTSSVEGVLAHYVANERFATMVAAEEPGWLNTDNRNVLEYMFARMVGRPVGFSVPELRGEARARAMHRPPAIDRGVDWEAVEDEWIAFHTGPGSMPLPAAMFTGERAARAQALADAVRGQDPKAVIATWSGQSRPPRGIAETTILARVYATAGDERARPLIEQVRAFNSIDADALEGLLAQEQRQPAQAVERYLQVLRRMHSDPTGSQHVLEAMLSRLPGLAAQDRKAGLRLHEALSGNFAVMQLEQRRRVARWEVAQHVNDAALIESLAEFEPLVPWVPEMLQKRLEVYQRRGHPLAAAAARDVNEYAEWMTDPRVLRQPAPQP